MPEPSSHATIWTSDALTTKFPSGSSASSSKYEAPFPSSYIICLWLLYIIYIWVRRGEQEAGIAFTIFFQKHRGAVHGQFMNLLFTSVSIRCIGRIPIKNKIFTGQISDQCTQDTDSSHAGVQNSNRFICNHVVVTFITRIGIFAFQYTLIIHHKANGDFCKVCASFPSLTLKAKCVTMDSPGQIGYSHHQKEATEKV